MLAKDTAQPLHGQEWTFGNFLTIRNYSTLYFDATYMSVAPMPLKQSIYRLSPLGYLALERAYRASPIGRRRMRAALQSMEKRLAQRSRDEAELYHTHIGPSLAVLGGPFAGTLYTEYSASSVLGPKLVGTYEIEIAGWIETAVKARYVRILDIGCAEGYYAIGFARRIPEAQVIGFDLDATALAVCRRHAELNGVERRLILEPSCTHSKLEQLIVGRTLIFCDIDGGERELLDPSAVPALRKADLIVETHDARSPGITAELVDRFRTSHDIEIVCAAPRDAADHPILARFPQEARARLIDEGRPADQCWMRLRARTAG